ncbi:hypothetical protein BDV95DRAFT_612591 [Massariosphaeria phaeospora]|uniref:DUF7730 domain-containing protein n=1 Tax=Massariosphaeria phaeospora TaxID=100035 RepID=A0A7C8MEX3_9PLEO|nr:hypothetical protein BDV95DRAFT_612591 [Massariosphaeria phaeospora]
MNLSSNLLRTCRQIYWEAFEYLYSDNHFTISIEREQRAAFKQRFAFHYVPWEFLPQSLQAIRHLRIFWEAGEILGTELRSQEWTNTWHVLSQMTGLRNLHIRLSWDHWGQGFVRPWYEPGVWRFHPIKEITAPKKFVIVLPDREGIDVGDIDVGSSNCVIRTASEEV